MRGRISPPAGLRFYCYLDAWLLVAHSPPLLRQHLAFRLRTVQALGLFINWDKSELVPTQCPTFGVTFRYPPAAGAAQPGEDRHYRGGGPAAAQSWATSRSLVDVLPDCRLLMRPLRLFFLRNYRPGRDPLSRRVPLPPTIRLLFRRWSRPEFLRSGNPLRVPPAHY